MWRNTVEGLAGNVQLQETGLQQSATFRRISAVEPESMHSDNETVESHLGMKLPLTPSQAYYCLAIVLSSELHRWENRGVVMWCLWGVERTIKFCPCIGAQCSCCEPLLNRCATVLAKRYLNIAEALERFSLRSMFDRLYSGIASQRPSESIEDEMKQWVFSQITDVDISFVTADTLCNVITTVLAQMVVCHDFVAALNIYGRDPFHPKDCPLLDGEPFWSVFYHQRISDGKGCFDEALAKKLPILNWLDDPTEDEYTMSLMSQWSSAWEFGMLFAWETALLQSTVAIAQREILYILIRYTRTHKAGVAHTVPMFLKALKLPHYVMMDADDGVGFVEGDLPSGIIIDHLVDWNVPEAVDAITEWIEARGGNSKIHRDLTSDNSVVENHFEDAYAALHQLRSRRGEPMAPEALNVVRAAVDERRKQQELITELQAQIDKAQCRIVEIDKALGPSSQYYGNLASDATLRLCRCLCPTKTVRMLRHKTTRPTSAAYRGESAASTSEQGKDRDASTNDCASTAIAREQEWEDCVVADPRRIDFRGAVTAFNELREIIKTLPSAFLRDDQSGRPIERVLASIDTKLVEDSENAYGRITHMKLRVLVMIAQSQKGAGGEGGEVLEGGADDTGDMFMEQANVDAFLDIEAVTAFELMALSVALNLNRDDVEIDSDVTGLAMAFTNDTAESRGGELLVRTIGLKSREPLGSRFVREGKLVFEPYTAWGMTEGEKKRALSL